MTLELLEDAVLELYPDLADISDSGSEADNNGYGQESLWLQFENVKPSYVEQWRDNYEAFARPFEDWGKKHGCILCHVMGDDDTRTLTFEAVV